MLIEHGRSDERSSQFTVIWCDDRYTGLSRTNKHLKFPDRGPRDPLTDCPGPHLTTQFLRNCPGLLRPLLQTATAEVHQGLIRTVSPDQPNPDPITVVYLGHLIVLLPHGSRVTCPAFLFLQAASAPPRVRTFEKDRKWLSGCWDGLGPPPPRCPRLDHFPPAARFAQQSVPVPCLQSVVCVRAPSDYPGS
ncbi:hypothetical protein J6590_007648 [Homalodisca vitripennis]|nr:hypothetical protein J6590_007648 [Homalodisca vitripennis]